MGVNYTEAVVRRGMSLEDYVAVTSTNAAGCWASILARAPSPWQRRRYHPYRPGDQETLSMADLHLRDYSPWEGWQVEGWPTTVILRGKVMVADGQLLGRPPMGN